MVRTSYEMRDGFIVKRYEYHHPEQLSRLGLRRMRASAICDLFVNNRFSIERIMTMLGDDYRDIVMVLIAHGVIADRRVLFRR